MDKVLLGAHVAGRYADMRHDFDEELGPLVEVLSCWGVFEWMLWDAFDSSSNGIIERTGQRIVFTSATTLLRNMSQ